MKSVAAQKAPDAQRTGGVDDEAVGENLVETGITGKAHCVTAGSTGAPARLFANMLRADI